METWVFLISLIWLYDFMSSKNVYQLCLLLRIPLSTWVLSEFLNFSKTLLLFFSCFVSSLTFPNGRLIFNCVNTIVLILLLLSFMIILLFYKSVSQLDWILLNLVSYISLHIPYRVSGMWYASQCVYQYSLNVWRKKT